MSFLAKSKGEVTYKDISGIHKWFLIVLISMGSSVIYTPMYLKNVFYEPLMQGLGCTNADLGALVSCYGIAAVICYLPSGIFADKFRMRTLAWIGFGGTAILTFIYATLPSLFMCYILFIGMGITSILIWWGTRFKVIRLCCEEDEYPARIGVSYSIYGVAGLVVGLINAAIVAAIPVPATGVTMVLVFLGVVLAVMAVLSYVFIPDFKGEIDTTRTKFFNMADYAEALRTPGVIWACLAYFAVYCVYQGATYTTPYMTAMGVDSNLVNVAGLIRTYGIGLLAGPILGVVAARIKSTKTILGCFIFAIVCLGVFIMLPQDPGLGMVAMALVVVFGFFTYGAFSIGSSPLSELGIPMRIFGTAAGILSVVGYIPDVFIHTWYGSIIDAQGTAAYNMIFAIEIAFAVFGVVMLLLCLRAVKKNAAANAQN